MPNSNARFLPHFPDPAGALLRDLRDGLRYVYEGRERLFAWNTTYLDLEALPFIRRTVHDRFGWPVYRFDVPLRLGTLETDGLQVHAPNDHMSTWRNDVPLHIIPFEIRLHGNGADNYWQVKTYLSAVLGTPGGWERADQLHAEWENDGLKLGLTYWFKSDISKEESGYVSLNIMNDRVFPEYFTDDYTRTFSLNAPEVRLQTFSAPYSTVPDFYRTSHWVRFTPDTVRELLKERKNDLAVWRDFRRNKLGFAKDALLCVMVELTENQQYMLRLVDHDRGQYTHEIRITRADGQWETVLSADVGALDGVVKMMESTGLCVERKEDAGW